ncbi:uncharacterized protein LOC111250616 [Varroa destructor]|uniref:C3H1-type domain-containing protein n=1 Tax=Varroa destructor TaxID=109461 RepID=A0A7M7K557_VARDE|nr:uncharacterized protein LOC111250616 [Varroa destructor]
MVTPSAAGISTACASHNDNSNSSNYSSNNNEQRQLAQQQRMKDINKQQKSRSISTTTTTAVTAAADTTLVTRPANAAANSTIRSTTATSITQDEPDRGSPHGVVKCGTALDDVEVQALWKMVNFTLPQAPAVNSDADILGVAHCWQTAGPAVTSSAASKELRNEIHDEQEELFLDIMLEARTLQALQASQDAQQQRIARIHAQRVQQRREQNQDDSDKTSACCNREDRNITGASTTASTASGYESSSYHDASLEYGSLPGCEEDRGVADLSCSLGYSEDSCGVPIEYLSHFSSSVSTITPVASCLFASPETYDSAIINSVRCIQDLQRRRQRAQRKPCTFYMEGNCRRTDCKFSHELAAITCRFWEEDSCFKGLACPFLHGYPPFEEELCSQSVGQSLAAGNVGPNTGNTHGSHHQHGNHHHHHHHHGNGHPKKDTIGHVAKRNSKFTIGGGGLDGVFCGSSSQPGSPSVATQLKNRSLIPPLSVAGVVGLRVFSRRLPVFKRFWPYFKESEQDFPSLTNQKSNGYLRAVAKKNLKKANGIVPKKAKKKKKKLSSTSSCGESKADTKESKDSNNNGGQSENNKGNKKTDIPPNAINSVTITLAAATLSSNGNNIVIP